LLIKYGEEKQPLTIQTEWMTLSQYGTHREDKFHTTEESRRYIQIPLNNNDALSKFIHNLDTYFTSDKFKNKYLTEKQQKYNYIPIFKDRGDENYPPSIKIKLDVDENGNILSEFFHTIDKENVKQIVNKVDDVRKVFPFMSEYRLLFKVSKIWFMGSQYGVKLKLVKAQIKPLTKRSEQCEFDSD